MALLLSRGGKGGRGDECRERRVRSAPYRVPWYSPPTQLGDGAYELESPDDL